ncbi:MAG: hypothetical protein ACK4N5_20670, partial [Myxococcales bacterium]
SWMNRATISHYVSMMALQSIVSFITGIQTLLWMLADLMQSIAAVACLISEICQKCIGVPIVGIACGICYGAFKAISVAVNAAAQIVYGILNSTWSALDALDRVVAKVIEFLSLANNKGMYMISKGMKEAVGLVLSGNLAGTFAEEIVKENAGTCNDSGIGTAYKGTMSLLNGAVAIGAYKQLFNDNSEKIPEGGTEVKGQAYNENNAVQKAERLMAELANATRTGPGGSPYSGVKFETRRGWSDSGSLLDSVGFEFAGTTRLVKSQNCSQFTQSTANCTGASFSGGGMGNNSIVQNAQKCDTAQQKCPPAESAYQSAQSKCDSDQNACNTCTPASSSTCQSKCSAATSSCKTADDKRKDRDKICGEAEDACDKMKGAEMSGGGSGQDVNHTGGKQYLFEGGAMGTTQFTQGGALSSAERVKPTGLAIVSGGSAKIVGIQTWFKNNDKAKSFHCRFKDNKNDRHQEIQIYP